jgi:hypothetical protein
LATNFGTAERVFNIGELFHSIHDALRPGGVAMHVLPAFGDIDHGFYNIHPAVYFDLAAADDYTIEDKFYEIVGISATRCLRQILRQILISVPYQYRSTT